MPVGSTAAPLGDPMGIGGDARASPEAASKMFHAPRAAGGLGSTTVAIIEPPRVHCPRTLPTLCSPRLTLTRAVGQRVLPYRGCWKPSTTEPCSGLPSGDKARYTLLETATWCRSNNAKGLSCPIVGLTPTCASSRRGDFFSSLSFKSQ